MYADQLDRIVVVRRDKGVRVVVVACTEYGDARCAVERVKAGAAVDGRAGRLECAVAVYADQLDGVAHERGDERMRCAA